MYNNNRSLCTGWDYRLCLKPFFFFFSSLRTFYYYITCRTIFPFFPRRTVRELNRFNSMSNRSLAHVAFVLFRWLTVFFVSLSLSLFRLFFLFFVFITLNSYFFSSHRFHYGPTATFFFFGVCKRYTACTCTPSETEKRAVVLTAAVTASRQPNHNVLIITCCHYDNNLNIIRRSR